MVIAALYIDPRGPYPSMPDVDCWDAERDARSYAGPYPIIAHPPCGPWGQLAHMSTQQDKTLAPLAVEQLIRWGGVLEHPHTSRLFRELGLPLPGGLPQVRGGRTLWAFTVDQVRFGHACRKRTTLLFADVDPRAICELPPEAEPTHEAGSFGSDKRRGKLAASAAIRRRTPPLFAEWLAATVRAGRADGPTPTIRGRPSRYWGHTVSTPDRRIGRSGGASGLMPVEHVFTLNDY